MTAAVRAAAVAALSLAAAHAAAPLLRHPRRRLRWTAWALLLTPGLAPPLPVGYAYAAGSLSLVRHPGVNALLYALLLAARHTVLAAAALGVAPSPVSPQAIHCRRLLQPGPGRGAGLGSALRLLVFRLRAGALRGELAAVCLVFLLAFGEFETASLMGIRTWTVRLFDAQAGGLALAESLSRLAGPFAVQACALLVTARVLWQVRPRARPVAAPRIRRTALAWVPPLVCAGLGAVVPIALLVRSALPALGALPATAAMAADIGASLGFAAAAAVAAPLWASRRSWPLAAPGLMGPLVLSLLLLAGLQAPAVRLLRDTPIPLAFGLALLVWPAALLLRLLIAGARHGTALGAARLLHDPAARARVLWRLEALPHLAAAGVVFIWACWDVTAPSILAPIGASPAPLRLYNLMHYGRTPALSVMVCLAMAAPVAVLAALYPIARLAWRFLNGRMPMHVRGETDHRGQGFS